MTPGGERDEVASADVGGLLDAWRQRLLRTSCLLSGSAMLLGTFVFWLMTGVVPPGMSVLGPVALVVMALPFMGEGWLQLRSFAYTTLLAAALATLGYHLGWSPGNVALSCLLVTTSGVLLNVRVGYALIALQALAMVVAGQAVRRGMFRVDSSLVATDQLSHWVRAALVLGVLGVALWALLLSVAKLIHHALAQATANVALAELQLKASRILHDTRVKDERKLRGPQKLQALGQLAGGLAHLVNNELTVVAGALHDLDTDPSESVRRDVAARITQAVARVAVPIRQMLTFSRSDEPCAERLDLARDTRAIIAELRPGIGSDVRVTTQGDDGLVLAIEPTRLRLLLLNLLLNAADALPMGGRVQVTVQTEPGQANQRARLALIIEDNGHGMTAEVLTRASDTFFTTRDRALHAGLGLSVAASIAEQSGGQLSLESAPQVGTRVRVSWPLTGEPLPTSATPHILMHPVQLTPFIPVQHAVEPTVVEPEREIDVDRWKDETIKRLARIGALLLAAILASVLFFSPETPRGFFLDAGFACVSLAVAGWTPSLRRGLRLGLLFGPFALAIGMTLSWFTFMAAALIATMSVVLVWGTMLGPPWVGLAILAWFMSTFAVAGYLHTAGLIVYDPALTSMDVAKNWSRVAFSLSAVQAGMLASISIIVRRAAHAIAAMNEANRRAQRTRQLEEEEGIRALLLEREATRVERMSVSGTAAGMIAHDVNNALQGLALASMLANPDLTPDELKVVTGQLRQAARYCAALVGLVAQDPGAAVAQRTAIDVSATLQRIATLLPTFLNDQVKLELEVEPNGWAVLSENDLQRIILNLATNAQDAMAGCGTLRVTLQREEDDLVLRVQDSGCGMDEATRARVFEPFFTTKPAGKGTGLGLHAVSRIVEETHGSLACQSQVQVGTTFTIRWPSAPEHRSRALQGAASAGPATHGPVLVAEDQALVRQVITRALRALGCDVHEAADGDAAIALIDSAVPWTALCIDGVMPGCPTSDVIDAFTARFPHRPVLLCSGHLPEELARRGMRPDRVTVINKPFSPEDLQRALTRALDQGTTLAPAG